MSAVDALSSRPPAARALAVLSTVLLAGLAVLGGCAGPSANERFFGLTDGAVLIASPAPADRALPGVVVSAVTIPELVDRPQIVTRDSTDRLVVSEQNLWAESIRSGVGRTLASRIGRVMADAGTPVQVGAYPQNSIVDPALRITVDVVRFDAVPNGEAVIDVLWSIRRPADDVVVTGRSVASSPIAGTGYDAIVHGWNDALATVDADIAAHVRGVGLAPRPAAAQTVSPAPVDGNAAPPSPKRRASAKSPSADSTR